LLAESKGLPARPSRIHRLACSLEFVLSIRPRIISATSGTRAPAAAFLRSTGWGGACPMIDFKDSAQTSETGETGESIRRIRAGLRAEISLMAQRARKFPAFHPAHTQLEQGIADLSLRLREAERLMVVRLPRRTSTLAKQTASRTAANDVPPLQIAKPRGLGFYLVRLFAGLLAMTRRFGALFRPPKLTLPQLALPQLALPKVRFPKFSLPETIRQRFHRAADGPSGLEPAASIPAGSELDTPANVPGARFSGAAFLETLRQATAHFRLPNFCLPQGSPQYRDGEQPNPHRLAIIQALHAAASVTLQPILHRKEQPAKRTN
jgi:hypothetical protein